MEAKAGDVFHVPVFMGEKKSEGARRLRALIRSFGFRPGPVKYSLIRRGWMWAWDVYAVGLPRKMVKGSLTSCCAASISRDRASRKTRIKP